MRDSASQGNQLLPREALRQENRSGQPKPKRAKKFTATQVIRFRSNGRIRQLPRGCLTNLHVQIVFSSTLHLTLSRRKPAILTANPSFSADGVDDSLQAIVLRIGLSAT